MGFPNYTGGYMFAVLKMRDREPIRITLDELGKAKFVLLRPKYVKALFGYLKAALSFIGYAGTYEVEGDRVIHRVKASFIPNWTGTELVRYFQFSGNRLTLTTPETDGTINILVWERHMGIIKRQEVKKHVPFPYSGGRAGQPFIAVACPDALSNRHG